MAIDHATFLREYTRQFGKRNPERMRMALWEWMVRHGGNPYIAHQVLGLQFDDEARYDGQYPPANPAWCFDRFGPTRTQMPDGRIICIGGEHEDFYDPDFCIYNDLIVLRPTAGEEQVTLDSGEVEIYGYPDVVFPPTDFHSATLVGDEIYVVGSLGYPDDRRIGSTPLYCFDTRSYQVHPVTTSGQVPGWISKHHAAYDAATHSVIVRGGRYLNADRKLVDSRGVHRLDLSTMHWHLVTQEDTYNRFKFTRSRHTQHLVSPDLTGFLPTSVAHTVLFRDSEYADHILDVQGIRVRLKDNFDPVRLIIEGELPTEVMLALLDEFSKYLNTGPDLWTFEDD